MTQSFTEPNTNHLTRLFFFFPKVRCQAHLRNIKSSGGKPAGGGGDTIVSFLLPFLYVILRQNGNRKWKQGNDITPVYNF